MRTLTQTDDRLPTPPISSADVPIEELPEIDLDAVTYSAFGHGVKKKGKLVARKRDGSKADSGDLYGSCDRIEAHEVGFVGELVSGALLGLDVDEEVHREGDPGYDHKIGEHTIDTKATATDNPRPKLVVSTDVPPADWFVLVHLRTNEGTARIIGFTDRDTVQDRPSECWPGDSTNYVVGWGDLYPPRYFSSLVQALGVTRMIYDEFIDARGCQMCGALLESDIESRVYVDEAGLETELCLCPDCADLISAAAERGYATDFRLYQRPDSEL